MIEKYFPAFLTILGWLIVLYNTDRIALRNESRASVDACIKKLEELIEEASNYLHERRKEEVNNTIKYKFENRVNFILSFLETKNSFLLKRTKKNFIKSNDIVSMRGAFNPSNSIEDIETAIEDAQDVIEGLEECFSKRFSENWYSFIPYWVRITLLVFFWLLGYFLLGKFFIGIP